MAIYGSPIMMGGGGDVSFIIASFPSSTTSYSLTGNGKTWQAVKSSSTSATYEVNKIGTYTFSANFGDVTKSSSVSVSAMHYIYNLAVVLDLQGTSWADISTVAKSGAASSNWKAGDTKTITMSRTTYTFAIMGFDTYDAANSSTYGRTKTGITFGMVDCHSTAKMNQIETSAQGWGGTAPSGLTTGCLMRTSTMQTLYENLPNDCKNVVTLAKIPYYLRGGSSMLYADDYLFLPAEKEVFGTRTFSPPDEASQLSQFAYYANGGSKVKYVGSSAEYWWLRSVNSNAGGYFCRVKPDGSAFYLESNYTSGVSPCFCV